jgi:nucleotide-binding universal stress UspA family protein
VIGTHGRGGFGKIVFGSVAEQIFRQAPCPVMVVGPHAAGHRVEDGAFQRILFATDCSKESLDQLPFAVDMANAFGAFLKVVNVVQESKEAMLRYVPDVVEEKRLLLEAAVSCLRVVHEPEVFVEVGPVVDGIRKVADINNVDLIIMGAHTTSSPAAVSHIPASITHFIASHAHCPVLAVRTGNHGLPVWQHDLEGSPL